MDQAVKTFTFEGSDARKWMARIIIAVILGEAIWSLILSVMNNVVVPWLGDVVGQSSGLPASFTQRPYNYPDLFVSILEVCIAATMAVILNYFFLRQKAGEVKPAKSPVPITPVRPARVVPPVVTAVANTQGMTPVAAPARTKPNPVTLPAPVPVAPAGPAPSVPPPTPVAVVPPAPPVATSVAAKPQPPAPKAEPPKQKKPKEAYYNIVGEPVPSDDD